MDLTAEKQLLAKLAPKLDAAIARRDDAQTDIDELGPVVGGLRAYIARHEKGPDQSVEARSIPSVERLGASAGLGATVGMLATIAEGMTTDKRVGLKERLRDLTVAAGHYDVDGVIAAYAARHGKDDMPKRVSFTNRLKDLVDEGHLEPGAKRGTYIRHDPDAPPGADQLPALTAQQRVYGGEA